MRAGSNWRHLNGLSLGMMGDPVRCLPKVVHPDVAALKLQHNPHERPLAIIDVDDRIARKQDRGEPLLILVVTLSLTHGRRPNARRQQTDQFRQERLARTRSGGIKAMQRGRSQAAPYQRREESR